MRLFALIVVICCAAAVTLLIWRAKDKRADRRLANQLIALQPVDPPRYDPSMVADQPEAVRRFFNQAIMPGTPLYTIAQIKMHGEFSLGSKADPNYMPMTAEQTLAAPKGFVWSMDAGSNLAVISGSDAAYENMSWTRFWVSGLLPVARIGNNLDHLRSAFGRYVAETVFWTPSALLPKHNVVWQEIDPLKIMVTVNHGKLSQSVDIFIDADGRPLSVRFDRWSDANPQKRYQFQPFGGHLSNFKNFAGFNIPTHVEAGNMFGTDDYFAFFKVNVTEVKFPH